MKVEMSLHLSTCLLFPHLPNHYFIFRWEPGSGTTGTYVSEHEEVSSQPWVLFSRSYPLCLLRQGPSLGPSSSPVRLDWRASYLRGSHLSMPSQSMQICVHMTTSGIFTWVLCIKLGLYAWPASIFLTSYLFSSSLPKTDFVFDHVMLDMVSGKGFA